MRAPRLRRGALGFAIVVGLALAPLVESCRATTGTDVGNGVVISLDMTGYEAPPAAGAKAIQLSSGVMVDELWVVTSRFRFHQGSDCSVDENEVDVLGPLVADLAGRGFVGGPRDINRKSGSYCRLKLEFAPIQAKDIPAGAPMDLADASILMRGRRSDGTPFVVRSRLGGELKLDPKSATFDIPQGQESLIIGFEIGAMTKALALDTLKGNPILVDDANNKAALQDFEAAVKAAGGLYRDGNDDGALEPAERASGQEIASGSP